MWVLQTISKSASDLLVGMRLRVGNERRLKFSNVGIHTVVGCHRTSLGTGVDQVCRTLTLSDADGLLTCEVSPPLLIEQHYVKFESCRRDTGDGYIAYDLEISTIAPVSSRCFAQP